MRHLDLGSRYYNGREIPPPLFFLGGDSWHGGDRPDVIPLFVKMNLLLLAQKAQQNRRMGSFESLSPLVTSSSATLILFGLFFFGERGKGPTCCFNAPLVAPKTTLPPSSFFSGEVCALWHPTPKPRGNLSHFYLHLAPLSKGKKFSPFPRQQLIGSVPP